ncbi:histidine phosphatase family protein [Pullulanibacillus sp. KACC 23026]|uniref:histidine phosphatase family protein n=1 Tax=Pullulanibacillus sp. KACC 23026 TaxID=3028315 RepID=UPI0023B187F4|nr:histidine phosphatase family protein [Pullulanibacillus sp. KACC 23026]WEG11782.1 histidine phosphatase family protein [Pullulanibacillus sp. KACC 23026]
MGRLYLTRHGETVWNREQRLQGRANSHLTERGIRQAEELASRLENKSIDIVISSPSERALKTATLLNVKHQLPIIQDEHFLEMDLGDWEGQLKADIERHDPIRSKHFWQEPHLYKAANGEDFYDLRNRVLPRMKSILQENKDRDILLVTHAVVLKTLMAYFENRPLEKLWEGPFIHSTCLTVIDFDGEESDILLYADTSHYSEPISF